MGKRKRKRRRIEERQRRAREAATAREARALEEEATALIMERAMEKSPRMLVGVAPRMDTGTSRGVHAAERVQRDRTNVYRGPGGPMGEAAAWRTTIPEEAALDLVSTEMLERVVGLVGIGAVAQRVRSLPMLLAWVGTLGLNRTAALVAVGAAANVWYGVVNATLEDTLEHVSFVRPTMVGVYFEDWLFGVVTLECFKALQDGMTSVAKSRFRALVVQDMPSGGRYASA